MNRIYLFIFVLFCLPLVLMGQQSVSYNLSFANAGFSGTTFCVDLYLSFDQGSDSLGTSNLVFLYDDGTISNPSLSSHSLSGPPFYQVPTLSTPRTGTASFNIELGSPGFGDEIAGSPSQTLIAKVCFDYPVSGLTVNLDWFVDGTAGTVLYLDNETTQLSPGTLQNYSGIPISFPVEWLDFGAELIGGNVELDWATATEVNNSHFEVERSFDGSLFEEIGQVAGVGNTTTAQTYAFTDPQVMKLGQDRLFYRLRQVDIDGRYSFSQVVELPLSNIPILLVEGRPNPFTEELNIHYANFSGLPFQWELTNSLGQILSQGQAEDRQGNIRIQAASWPQGVYFLSAESESEKVMVELLKR